MIQTTNSAQQLEQKFYEQKFYFSYSSLNRLIFSPRAFYKDYVLGQKEVKTDPHLIEGRATHCLLLENKKFEELFTVVPTDLPKDNNKKVTDAAFTEYLRIKEEEPKPTVEKLDDLGPFILKYLQKINLHQTLKTDEQRLAKMLIPQNSVYFEYLKVKGGKDLIDEAMLERCKLQAEALRTHKEARTLMGLDVKGFELFQVENEKFFSMDIPEYEQFGLKGIIDNVTIDFEKKIVLINDLKTTSKSLTDFPDTVNYYNYWLQVVIYTRLVAYYLRDVLDESWKIEFRFVVIDCYMQIYAFPVSQTSLEQYGQQLQVRLREAAYHYGERDYTLPYRYAVREVYL